MPISLVNNISSLSGQARLNTTSFNLNKTLNRLSSGLRINNSGDDAAGLAIANRYRSDIASLRQGVRNANEAISTFQIVDGGLGQITQLLDRASTLASQSASDSFAGDRNTLNREMESLLAELGREAESIGLGGAAGSEAGRYNKALSVFIGGGVSAQSTTNTVGVDLSNSRVDKVGLNLEQLNIGLSTGRVVSANVLTASMTQNELITIQYASPTGGALKTTTVSLTGGVATANAQAIVDEFNASLGAQEAAVTASLNTNTAYGNVGALVLTSSNIFATSSNISQAVASSTGIAGTGATTAVDTAVSTVAYRATTSVTAGVANATQTLAFSGNATTQTISYQVPSAGATVQTNQLLVESTINNNADLQAAGVYAFKTRNTGATFTFASARDFTMNISGAGAPIGANVNQTAQAASYTLEGGSKGAKKALDAFKSALTELGIVQGKVGAGQNTLQQAIELANVQVTNFQAAESRLRDADMAEEASNLSRLTVLQQAGVASLAQANQSVQAILSLLQ